MLAGAAASVALVATVGHPLLSILLGVLVGAGYSASLKPTSGTYVDNLMAGGALGVPLWGLISVIAIPLFSSRMPEWEAEQIRVHFPALVGWVMYGAGLGLLTQTFSDIAARYLGVEIEPEVKTPRTMTRIVILGGGFAGMRTAERLEAELRANPEVSLTLVSEQMRCCLLPCSPKLPAAAWSPSHISTPLRSTLHRTEFVRGRATGRS
jgi:NADH dehydrogenase